MSRLNSANRSVLVGTEAGSLLLRYAASRPAQGLADPVALPVFNERGEPENVIVPVARTLDLVAEVSDEDFGPGPENTGAIRFLPSGRGAELPSQMAVEPAATDPE